MESSKIVFAVRKNPHFRNKEDLERIFCFLRSLIVLQHLRDSTITTLCEIVRYEVHDANEVLFCRGDICGAWYILLSGSTFIDSAMYIPYHWWHWFDEFDIDSIMDYNNTIPSGYATLRRWKGIHERRKALQRSNSTVSFGKRHGDSIYRTNECVVLEPSEMIAIDYPDMPMIRQHQMIAAPETQPLSSSTMMPTRSQCKTKQPRERFFSDNSVHLADLLPSSAAAFLPSSCDRSSRGSDTSSGAFSAASDAPFSSHSQHRRDSTASLPPDTDSEGEGDGEVDLLEDMPDGENGSICTSSCTFRDAVRECLEREPVDRSEEDIEALLEFMQRLPAFSTFNQSVRRLLCQVMVFASVEKSGTIVMQDGEELDSWSVIINGAVQIEFPDGQIHDLHIGDSFGITPTMEKLYHRGTMRTKVDDCQFVCVAQVDYYQILNQGEEHTRKIEGDNGEVVMMIENRILDATGRRGPVLIKATPARLIAYLIEEHCMTDPWYIEDFLLTYRTFLSSPMEITDRLLMWYADPSLRDRATRIVLLWVNNHFIDFESHPAMISFLEHFQSSLELHKKTSQLRMLHIACAAKARQRTVTLTRSTRTESLNFSILGGWDRGFGVYICEVKPNSRAEQVGLRKGDQILQVNGVRFEHITHSKAFEILKGATHFSIGVRSNLLGYREMLTTPADSPRHRHRHRKNLQLPANRLSGSDIETLSDFDSATSIPALVSNHYPNKDAEGKKSFLTIGNKTRLKKALMRMNIIPKELPGTYLTDDTPFVCQVSSNPTGASSLVSQRHHSRSNPDLLAGVADCEGGVGEAEDNDKEVSQFPDRVLKVYRSDQTFKYLLVHKETTAREIVMLALAEFGLSEPSQNFCLCQVSVETGCVIKQRRLPDEMSSLSDSIPLNGRFYLKSNLLQETLVADEIAPDIWRESQINLLQLNTLEVAAQLTIQDFAIFKQIDSSEYIDELFGSAKTSCNLHQFEELVNREMFWVIMEICLEAQTVRRAKIVKHFIKIAKHFHDAKNLNSCFAVICGLNHGCVQRLKNTWEKVPQKYVRIFDSLAGLMDPSRNMSKYRHLIAKWSTTPPVIPFYPIVRKDLTFLHEGNESREGPLINFEKLRMISKEIRQLKQFTSVPYYLSEIFDGACAPSATVFAMAGQAGNPRRNHGSRSLPSRKKITTALSVSVKKLYEEAQMVRKVKQYWNNLVVEKDESKLLDMSNICEPPANPVRRQASVPEPVPIVVTGPKFGQQSPHAVQKLLSLSESSKVRQHASKGHHAGRPRSPAASPKPPPMKTYGHPPFHHNRTLSEAGSFGNCLKPPYINGMLPVDLTAESSSVTVGTVAGLIALRKSQSGSVTSTESVSQASMADSGMASSSLESCSSSVNSSPSLNRMGTPPIHITQIQLMPPPRNTRVPPPPQLPPRDRDLCCYIKPRAPQPPDYQSATMSRKGNFGGVLPATNSSSVMSSRRAPLLHDVGVSTDHDGAISTV